MDTRRKEEHKGVCYSGGLYELIRRFQGTTLESIDAPDEFIHAIRTAYVVIEGDCELLEKILVRVREAARGINPDVSDAFTALLQGLLATANNHRISLMWNEVDIGIEEEQSGRRLSVTIRGMPKEALITLKSITPRRDQSGTVVGE
ncbi:MAG TPA: hypothetical protein EYP33_04320 [Pyrodictium sp.]|nr:hypothetical protein [Pyrodictium sp.]